MKIPGKRATSVFLLCFVQQQHCLHTGSEAAKHQGLQATDSPGSCRNASSMCQSLLQHSECDLQTGTCQCGRSHPVRLDNKLCLAAVSLDSQCRYNEECHHEDSNTICLQVTSTSSYCRCAKDYEKLLLSDRSQCIQSKASPTTHTVPTLAGLGIGLSVLTCFLCFTLRLFSKARTVETRGYGDASMNPTIMIDGKDMTGDVESCSRASSKSRIYTPGAPLTPTQVRRMSTLSTLSVTVQDKDFTVRPVSPGIATGSNDPLFEQDDDEVEQQLTVIPRIGSLRRKSLIDYAFPELHQKSNGPKVSNSLLILTRTKTDSQGRRHSVAVPLLQTPEGSRNDSGYLVERKLSGTGAEVSGRGRRHSLQPASKSPMRRQGSRRASSRRPSKQGFYQFLDQAVAH